MPLSEQEQRLLDEMERGLYHSDADDVTTVGASRGRAGSTAILLGLIGLIAGVALLVVGVMVRLPIVGVIGFVAMFAGALLLIAPPRRLTVSGTGHVDAPRPHRSSFMDSLGERWDRRNDDDEH
jgi:Flp pilus assembly protein TadB